jgi:glutamate/tyrosine decarboxylase-like PLP-dependent enzyme
MTIRTFGTDRLAATIERCCALAQRLAATIARTPELELRRHSTITAST